MTRSSEHTNLATFLERSRDEILDASIAFARGIPALRTLDEGALRDHLPQILGAISADLRTRQSRTESISKSHGEAVAGSAPTSAETHGQIRAQLGLNIEQLVAEYRALRSSVLRLWIDQHPPGKDALEDMTRFNEAIDQAVGESVQFFAQERERWRQIYLGVLGHDLRGPLNAISLAVDLVRVKETQPSQTTAVLTQGVKRLSSLLDTLLDYCRASFGLGMVLQRAPVDLGAACAEEIELLRAATPETDIQYSVRGNVDGEFDASRVREALSNLVSNSVKHGNPPGRSVVEIEGDGSAVRISVENAGDISEKELESVFEPLYQGGTSSAGKEDTHLGLGLFISRQIARAHEGEVSGICADQRVRSTIELPKKALRKE